MKILVVGGGGREHVLSWKLAASPNVSCVYVAPGNAGTAREPGVSNVDIPVSDIDRLLQFARDEAVQLTVIGPEAPLVDGIVDRFTEAGLPCLGPCAAAARLEGSKAFAKEFMARYQIPTASYQSFTDAARACEYVADAEFPVVIKADGLAAGKGVVIAADLAVARQSIVDMLSGNRFGAAGSRVVIESFLQGEEASFICLVDGKHVLPMASSQDHKAAWDGDMGPNTGGMGAYSPSPLIDQQMTEKILENVIVPVITGMAEQGTPYVGFLYAGLMIGADRIPRVVEFNCRFGDPEAQPVLSRLRSDFASLCLAAVEGRLDQQRAEWDSRPSLGVVIAANGYPDDYQTGNVITGLDRETASDSDSYKVFHAGTRVEGDAVVTSGGRVLCITASGETVLQAQQRAYAGISDIHWDGCWYRQDIGYRAIARESGNYSSDSTTDDAFSAPAESGANTGPQ